MLLIDFLIFTLQLFLFAVFISFSFFYYFSLTTTLPIEQIHR